VAASHFGRSAREPDAGWAGVALLAVEAAARPATAGSAPDCDFAVPLA
jgi:hypothetical protein